MMNTRNLGEPRVVHDLLFVDADVKVTEDVSDKTSRTARKQSEEPHEEPGEEPGFGLL